MEITVFRDFAAIPADMAHALSVSSGLPFFKSIEWFNCLFDNGLSAATLRIYVAHNSDGPHCALYCLAQGRQLQSLSSYYTIEYGAAIESTSSGEGLNEIVAHIVAERPRWTTVGLRNLHDGDLLAVQKSLKTAGFATHTWPQYENWYLDVAGQSFEQYYGALSSKLRNTVERKSRKAKKAHTIRLAIFPGEGLSLDEVTEHYETIYAASWKEAEPFAEFMPALFRICHEHDLARIGLAWVDDEPAAAQIWINESDRSRTFIYKLAYDEKFGALSIGSMLSKKMFQHAIDTDRVKEIDYGVGDEPYKRDWMSGSRSLNGLLACNRKTLRGQLKNLREILASRRPL